MSMPKNSQPRFYTVNEIRSEFLNYFATHKHTIVPSSSLVPHNDPTLLFTNAGMVPFKNVFLGKETLPYHRATSSQRCVRAGGKHNDLENVGYTARHHTFFEMLGNFSFGDYFKREAIQFAWDFLTKDLGLPPEKLWISVYTDDDEAADIWLNEIKINPQQFSRCGDDNFWVMGPTGPCGPCTEIFYDHGAHIYGGPPGSPEEDGDRYIEIWNIVFMQYNRDTDGTLNPLPKPSVDTGMGLERIAAVLQHVENNYEIDLFQNLIKFIASLVGTADLANTSMRVIADHIRSCTFLIVDGVIPSNEGRGYVLRRIIRRALRHGDKLGLTEPFFYKLVQPLVKEMGEAYPELVKGQKNAEKILLQEEEQFSLTLSQGLKLFDQAVSDLQGTVIPGETVFKLYDTYGFPIDLTADIARERNLTVDEAGFEAAMNQQRDRSRKSSKFDADYTTGANITQATEFVGYKNFHADKTIDSGEVIALYRDGQPVDTLSSGDTGSVILTRTPFYAESGGQIGDQGVLRANDIVFRVVDTIKQGSAHVHVGKLENGTLKVGATLTAQVDAERREATVLNHSATHLLHMVLRQTLGDHVIQKGSLVEPERLRFDYSHSAPLAAAEIQLIEDRVNQEIRSNHTAKISITTPEKAIAEGAMGLFGEKYGAEVRVIEFGDSKELCGGTHAHATGNIGVFKITSESGIASGIRRIEAVTGDGALRWLDQRERDAKQKLHQADERVKNLEKQLDQLKSKLVGNLSQDLAALAQEKNGVKILAAKVDHLDAKSLRNTVDQLKDKLGSAVVVLAVVNADNKVSLVAGVTKDQIARVKAGELVNMLAQQIGGKGGGRPDLAEAGGNQPENLAQALDSVKNWVEARL
jgi:alanyl-tRNA synthetase